MNRAITLFTLHQPDRFAFKFVYVYMYMGSAFYILTICQLLDSSPEIDGCPYGA